MSVLLHKGVDELRKLSNDQLAQHMAYYKPGAPDYILSEMEFKRRQNRWPEIRSWIAIAISIGALIASFVAIAIKATP